MQSLACLGRVVRGAEAKIASTYKVASMTSCVVEEQLRIRDSFVYVCPTVSVNSTEEQVQ